MQVQDEDVDASKGEMQQGLRAYLGIVQVQIMKMCSMSSYLWMTYVGRRFSWSFCKEPCRSRSNKSKHKGERAVAKKSRD